MSSKGLKAGQKKTPFVDALNKVCAHADADILLLAGGLYDTLDYELYDKIRKLKRHDNIVLLMATFGGSPDVSYKISRMLQKGFAKFTVVIDAYCKSGGTLVVMGAHDLVMSRRAELGPLDIQIGEVEEKQRKSGLAPVQALKILQEQVAESYMRVFETLNENLQIQAKSAMATADHIVSSLFSEIYRQLDPIRLAEYERALTIMKEYGRRLMEGSDNLKEGALDKLVKEYPDHSFVIDRFEADELFTRVREPNEVEQDLLKHLNGIFAQNINKTHAFLEYYPGEPEPVVSNEENKDGQPQHAQDGKPGGVGAGVPEGPPGGAGAQSEKGEIQKADSATASYHT